ncbi:MAG: hypothetical protein WC977_12260 [Anaerovoracaceae bacterium]
MKVRWRYLVCLLRGHRWAYWVNGTRHCEYCGVWEPWDEGR